MKLTLMLQPNEQAIFFIDQLMESYTKVFHPDFMRECCFVMHELVINAVEAMVQANSTENIEVIISCTNEVLEMTIIDCAAGIPKEQWNAVLEDCLTTDDFSDRGRGLFFIKHMVDSIWFEQLDDARFSVNVKKTLKH